MKPCIWCRMKCLLPGSLKQYHCWRKSSARSHQCSANGCLATWDLHPLSRMLPCFENQSLYTGEIAVMSLKDIGFVSQSRFELSEFRFYVQEETLHGSWAASQPIRRDVFIVYYALCLSCCAGCLPCQGVCHVIGQSFMD